MYILLFLPVKGAVTILLHLKKITEGKNKMGVKVTDVNDNVHELVPIMN